MSPELDSTLMLLFRVPGEGTYNISMLALDGDIGDVAQKLLERLPVERQPEAASAVWRAIAGDRLGIIREQQMKMREYELQLAFSGVSFQEVVG